MTRDTAYASVDYTQVEPLLVRSSGGSNPQAAVAWVELETAIATRLDALALERAIASLFADVLLVGGITESRPATEGSGNYFFTRFEVDLGALFGSLWATRRIIDDGLLDALGNRLSYSYDFKITGNGTFTIEFQSASNNPVIADGIFTLIVQRRPALGTQEAAPTSTPLLNNQRFTFPNGAMIVINDDFTTGLFTAAGVAQPQQNDTAAGTKVRSDGFISIYDNGTYWRYLLSADGFVLPPTASSLAEYNAF